MLLLSILAVQHKWALHIAFSISLSWAESTQIQLLRTLSHEIRSSFAGLFGFRLVIWIWLWISWYDHSIRLCSTIMHRVWWLRCQISLKCTAIFPTRYKFACLLSSIFTFPQLTFFSHCVHLSLDFYFAEHFFLPIRAHFKVLSVENSHVPLETFMLSTHLENTTHFNEYKTTTMANN